MHEDVSFWLSTDTQHNAQIRNPEEAEAYFQDVINGGANGSRSFRETFGNEADNTNLANKTDDEGYLPDRSFPTFSMAH